ncbi:rRNA pseudouridine synthase [Puniceicoccales bacterium CK1056]|uniref:Pseudouridine synthase n=1 Tax=Oceanipulchritudo coccoides TaxID=2706888 RepID=A0A6B2M0T0_9BACT|nr:pseudouridine synthase [Oceanipulchritudo coccoides]NDV62002.1 rRNA pseudouridine synthase [Oceanipulchritudo coccoides]
MRTEKPVRVQKVIADRGLASRRQAEEWIEEGRVTVNDQIITLGDKCLPSQDQVAVDGNPIPRREPQKLVLAMNKPKGVTCTNSDPHAKRTVFDLLPKELQTERLFCVGRLDLESEGLLLLTNDGQLKQELTHPSFNVVKLYSVEIDKPLQPSDVPKLIRGIKWEGEPLAIDKVFPSGLGGKENWKKLEVTLHHGKKREIRRLFYAFGYDVKKLRRFQIGQYAVKGIPRGGFRILGKRDIKLLFASPGGAKPT